MKIKILASLALALISNPGWAVSPEFTARGAQLFIQHWESRSPAHGSDGLGPLFNATSCATCHQQGGIGGAGDASCNAASIGIESIDVYGRRVNGAVLANLVSHFHPGFVQPDNSIVNVLTLPHHGGSQIFRELHGSMTQSTSAEFSDTGGPSSAAEVRVANDAPIIYEQIIDGYRIRISARMYGRNTTALFGSGLIDRVPDMLLAQQAQLQKKHPEIHGHPSTLVDGRFGKFGWRANLATLLEFNDKACANEVGLQTRRVTQGSDATNRGYRNKGADISDEQLLMLTQFVQALPAPRQQLPSQSLALESMRHGEALFNQAGCNICHVRDMPPAVGLFSDLLLHDMGRDSIDLSHAEPYIVNRELVTKEIEITPSHHFDIPTSYAGLATNIPLRSGTSAIDSVRPAVSFRAPSGPTTLASFRVIDSKLNFDTKNNSIAISKSIRNRSDTPALVRTELRERMDFQPTNFNQEWRTAPLWGLHDSAPYWHDGRAETVLEAIAMHDGEAAGTRDRFLKMSYEERLQVLAFLDSLVAP